jgi:uncharacterized protein
MRSVIGYVLFLSIFLSIYTGMNAYVALRLCRFFGIRKKSIKFSIVAMLTLSFIFAAILERNFATGLTRVLYIGACIWMGTMLLSFATLLLFELVWLIFPLRNRTKGIIVSTIVALLVVYSMINVQQLTVRQEKIPAPVNMKIVQLSDIHLDSSPARHLQKIVDQTNKIGPDIVVITGDLIDYVNKRTLKLLPMINKIDAPIFFTTGNHEKYAGLEKVMKALEKTKIHPLRNEIIDHAGIQIIGIDDNEQRNTVAEVLKYIEIDPDKFSLLLYHRPVGLEAASEKGIDLMLSGHTHSGQIFPFNFFVKLHFNRLFGIYHSGDTTLNVTSGTGYWGPPMRLGSKCEIVVLQLTKEE